MIDSLFSFFFFWLTFACRMISAGLALAVCASMYLIGDAVYDAISAKAVPSLEAVAPLAIAEVAAILLAKWLMDISHDFRELADNYDDEEAEDEHSD